jgi:branched-chain amino acid transport system permease protein
VLELIVISTLNGVLFGMLLFLMASGLTVIFSMLGVLNFAHASSSDSRSPAGSASGRHC